MPVVERIGNVRIDGLTAALSDDAGETTGWELTLIRGEFDAQALLGAARGLAHPADGVVKYGTMHGIPIVQTDVDTHIMFPSNNMMIIVMADEDKDRFARMLAMVYALEAGHGGMTEDKDLNGLIGKVDTTLPLWLVGTFNAEERREKLLSGVDWFAMTGVRKKEGLAVRLAVAGDERRSVKRTLEELNGDVKWVQQVMPQAGGFLPISAFLGSVRTEMDARGSEAVVSAEVKGELPGAGWRLALPMLDWKGAGAGQPGAVVNPPRRMCPWWCRGREGDSLWFIDHYSLFIGGCRNWRGGGWRGKMWYL